MSATRNISHPLILLGAGGHAKVLLALALAAGHAMAGVCDPQLAAADVHVWRGLPVLGGDDVLYGLDPKAYGLINGVGQLLRQDGRQRLYETWREKGFVFPSLIHPFAWVADDVRLADGVQVMAGAVIQPESIIGANTTINTHASIDHDCRIGAHVHIAPGATLCGGIQVADGVYIGAGATLIQNLSIGNGAIIGAGVTCARDVAAGEMVIDAAVRRFQQPPNS